MTLQILDGIGAIAGDYDGFILDLWGVLHDGSKPFPGVLDALDRLGAADKKRVVLSNAPRRASMVSDRVAEIGIPRDRYDALHCSGEEAWLHLHDRDDAFYRNLGRRVYFVGPKRDDPLLEGLDYQRVPAIEEADFLVAVGPGGWENDISSYQPLLDAALKRGLPLVCANPDLVVMHKGRASICAGAMALYYEEKGGPVRWHGKPYASVYEHCFKLFAERGVTDKKRILAVGDSLRTDIAGAAGVGIDSLLVASGIHAEEIGFKPGAVNDPTRVEAMLKKAGFAPRGVMAEFRW